MERIFEEAAAEMRRLTHPHLFRHDAPQPAEVTHACPPDGTFVTPCCGRTPFDLIGDRITLDPSLVTCNGATAHAQAPAPQPVTLAAAAAEPKENPMSIVTDVRADLATAARELAAKAAEFEQVVLPAAASRLQALEGNPVVDALLSAAHVPPEALGIIVKTIEGLEELYNVPAPAEAAPVAPVAQ